MAAYGAESDVKAATRGSVPYVLCRAGPSGVPSLEFSAPGGRSKQVDDQPPDATKLRQFIGVSRRCELSIGYFVSAEPSLR